MRPFCSAGLLAVLFFHCVSANGSWEDRIFIHCPKKLHRHDNRDQVASYIETTLFSGKLNQLLLEQKKIGFKYHIPKPGTYESVGGEIEFYNSGNVQSLRCEYLGPGGIDSDVIISINSTVPYSVMKQVELDSSKLVECMPFSNSYGTMNYVPCVLEPDFSLIVSHGPALEIVEHTEDGVQISSEDHVVIAARDSAAYYLSALDLDEKKDISSLCSNTKERNHPLYISSSQRQLYEFVLESDGQNNFLVCYGNGLRKKSMAWRGHGYDYSGSRHSYQQEGNSQQSRAYEWRQQSRSGGSNEWRQSGSQNRDDGSRGEPTTGLKEFIASNIVYLASWFGYGDFVYQIIGGGPVEKAYAELGLPMHNADKAMIRKKCRAIKAKHHPDNGGRTELFHYYSNRCEVLN